MQSDWSDVEKETLRALRAAGKPFSTCAANLPGRSRSACIGMARRLGIPGAGERKPGVARRGNSQRFKINGSPRKPKLTRRERITARAEDLARYGVPTEDGSGPDRELFTPVNERKTLEHLEAHHCRFVNGDPQEPGWHYCSKRVVLGTPYCEGHFARCYIAHPTSRRHVETKAEVRERIRTLEPAR